MHFLQIDINNHGQFDGHFAFQIKTAYLLSDVTNIIGPSTFLITFDHVAKNLTVPQICVIVVRDAENQDPALIGVIEKYLKMCKDMRAMKHAPNKVFIAFKDFENTLKKALESWTISISTQSKNSGFKGIFELFEENTFAFYHPTNETTIPDKAHLNVLQVLSNKAPLNAIDNSIWLMPLTFYTTEIYECDAITDINLISTETPYLIKCLTLTNNLFASQTELTAIKQQLANEILPFKTAMEEWALACRKGSTGSECFKNKVYPTIKETQDAIENNTIIKHLQIVDAGKIAISLFMGEVAPPTLWKFYMLTGMLSKEDFENLVAEYDNGLPYSLPVILFIPDEAPLERYNLTVKIEEIENLKITVAQNSFKKSILID